MGSERRFTLKRELGSGAFGTVYLAEMESMGGFKKDVAVKLLNESLGNFADASKRLRDEARLLGRLQHRNIVRVDDLLRLDGRWAIVMEHIQGYDLELIIQAREELGEEMSAVAAMEVVAGVSSALDAAWSSKAGGEEPLRVVHRDIKPSNIRLTHSGEVKVLDFGIARAEFSGREAKTGQIRYGSLGYLSPERLIGEPEVPAGDVFAVGCVAYELLVGEALGRVELKPEAQVQQVEEAVARVRAALEGQPPEAVEQCLSMLARSLAYEVEDRPTSGEMAAQAKELVKRFEGEALHDFAGRALARLPEVFDDQTRPARGVLTEEGLTTGGTPVAEKPVSNPTLVFDDFGPAEDTPAEAPQAAPAVPEASAPATESEPEKKSPLPWILGIAALALVGVGAAFAFSGDPPQPPPEPVVDAGKETTEPDANPVVAEASEGDPVEGDPVEGDPVEGAPVEGDPVEGDPVEGDPVEGDPVEGDPGGPAGASADAQTKGENPTPRRTGPDKGATTTPEPKEEPVTPPVEEVAVSTGPRLRSAKFSVPGATAVSVTCGDVSGSGSTSALLRELPAGTCSVRAEVDGATLKGSAKVTKPAGFTCTPSEGALTCR